MDQHYKKLIIWGMLASFPAAVYSLQDWQKTDKAPAIATADALPEVDTKELERAVDVRLKRIAEIDVKILSAKGEVLKFQEQKHSLIRELEKIQERIKPHLRQARR